MHILLTGGTGFIGSALCEALQRNHGQLTILSRRPLPGDSKARYVLSLDQITANESIDAIVNLAGASLADKRWTSTYKQEVLSSRLDTTREVVGLIRRLDTPPSVLLSASAIGYYGHRGNVPVAEDETSKAGFAAELCERWEAEALAATGEDVRVCLLRLGVVLGRDGGAMKQMSRSFRLGIATWLGTGEQWLSWIHLEDVLASIAFLLAREDLSGPFNLTAPGVVTSRGFCDAMKLCTPTFITAGVPSVVLRLVVGEMAEELLLNGQRVEPRALTDAGFQFTYPELNSALSDII